MKKTFLYALSVLVLLSLFGCMGLGTTKIADIKNNPRNYVGKEVTVSGTVTRTFSLFVIKYFTLNDNTGEITVITERPLPREGQQLKVKGVVREAFAIGPQSHLVVQEEPQQEK